MRVTQPTLFLAGSIEMGAAEDWQAQAIDAARETFSIIYNPRRDDWDPTWAQTIEHPEFNAQVTWELDHIDEADVVSFYFDPNTKSPITLMELGLAVAIKDDLIVCCPEGFWRKGNVDILCARYGVRVLPRLDDFLAELSDVGAIREGFA